MVGGFQYLCDLSAPTLQNLSKIVQSAAELWRFNGSENLGPSVIFDLTGSWFSKFRLGQMPHHHVDLQRTRAMGG